MKFKDILVHLDNTEQCATRLELAIKFAGKHGARLTGMYVVTHRHYQPQSEAMDRKAQEAEQLFRQRTAGIDLDVEFLSIDWGVVGVSVAEVLNYFAHAKDLVVVGQSDPHSQESDTPADLPERVVMGSGRAVLIVPFAGTFETIGERVIVGWKAGRASARAVNDAMPFLLHAGQVSVLSIKNVGDRSVVDHRADCDICAHLKLYDINVKKEELLTADIPVADIMMNYAWENGSDLIVVGAYVHTTRGIQSLGPVDKAFLKKMTVPVLMSH